MTEFTLFGVIQLGESAHDPCQSVLNDSRNAQAERKNMIRKVQQGFTLIEMMIVVAIIGIVASIAIPLYTDYLIRTQVGEGISLSASVKVAATEYFQEKGVFAITNAEAGVEIGPNIAGGYVTQVQLVAAGAIQITFGNRVHPNINGAVLMVERSL